MIKCECGNDRFSANQICRHEVYIDVHGNYLEDSPTGIFDADDPYGPFECTSCGKSYENLQLLEDYDD
jgi:hypothetical protein